MCCLRGLTPTPSFRNKTDGNTQPDALGMQLFSVWRPPPLPLPPRKSCCVDQTNAHYISKALLPRTSSVGDFSGGTDISCWQTLEFDTTLCIGMRGLERNSRPKVLNINGTIRLGSVILPIGTILVSKRSEAKSSTRAGGERVGSRRGSDLAHEILRVTSKCLYCNWHFTVKYILRSYGERAARRECWERRVPYTTRRSEAADIEITPGEFMPLLRPRKRVLDVCFHFQD